MNDDTKQKAAWAINEWADALSISRATVNKLIADDVIRTVKFGHRRLVTTPPAEFLETLGD